MNRLSKYFINHCEPSTQWLLPIHDELFIEVHKKDHSRLLQSKIIDLMQRDSNMVGVPIPLPVSMKVSDDYWSNAKEIKP
jgi:DNA polymerase I-like protein with 3'-5' exonuclease and polymerase domains